MTVTCSVKGLWPVGCVFLVCWEYGWMSERSVIRSYVRWHVLYDMIPLWREPLFICRLNFQDKICLSDPFFCSPYITHEKWPPLFWLKFPDRLCQRSRFFFCWRSLCPNVHALKSAYPEVNALTYNINIRTLYSCNSDVAEYFYAEQMVWRHNLQDEWYHILI